MSVSRAVQKAQQDLEAVKAKLSGELKFGEAAALMTEYNRLTRFIYYRMPRTTGKISGQKNKP